MWRPLWKLAGSAFAISLIGLGSCVNPSALDQTAKSPAPPNDVAPCPEYPPSSPWEWAGGPTVEVPLGKRGNDYWVPVNINDRLTVDFQLDSGAEETVIPHYVFDALVRACTILQNDIIGPGSMTGIGGAIRPIIRIKIHALRVEGYPV
jgi:hypothetical protein